MPRWVNRLVFPVFAAMLLVGAAVGPAAAWDTNCTTSRVCVWANGDYGLPMAAMSGSNSNYGTQAYPNTTQYINDSISSVENLYNTKDVIFHHDPNNSGNAFCVDSYGWYSYVGFWDNDTFSSHAVTADDNAC